MKTNIIFLQFYNQHTFDCSNHFLRYNVEKEVEIDGKDCSVIYAYKSYKLQPFVKQDDSLIVWENDNKVYFYQFDDFHLVYDFTLEVGDTLNYFLPTGKTFFSPYESEVNDTTVIAATLFIEEISEVNVNGTILKRFKTDIEFETDGINNVMDYIVENVGSENYQVLGSNQIIVASGCGPDFLCYENDDFSYPPDIQCEYPTSTDNIYTDQEINISPNPTNGLLYINNKTTEVINNISVFDMSGKVISQTINPENSIDLAYLQHGLYLVKLTFKSGEIHIKKIMKY